MKPVLRGLCLIVLAGCGGRSFGPDRPATPEELAVAQAGERTFGAFTADSIDADMFGAMAGSVFVLANASYASSQAIVAPHGIYADCASISPDRVDYHCSINGTTLSGYVSRSLGSAGATWHLDLSSTSALSTPTNSINTSMRLRGSSIAAGNQVDGSLSLEANVHFNHEGRTTDVSLNADISSNHLVFDTAQSCAESGNFVVDLDASSGSNSVSQAVRYTFTGCQMVMVAVSK